jgi:hypothetical protein
MMDVNKDHVEGFSAKREFTSTHIQTINISALNVKLLQIYFKLLYIEFLQQKCKPRCESDTFNDTRAISCPKIPPSAAVNAYQKRYSSDTFDDTRATSYPKTRFLKTLEFTMKDTPA